MPTVKRKAEKGEAVLARARAASEAARSRLNAEDGTQESSLTFREFINRVRPSFRWYKHCEVLASVLQRVADGEIKRLFIFMPPRHGKSEMASRLFTAYYLYRFPERWVGLSSYSANLAKTLSNAARDNFLRAGGEIKAEVAAKEHWESVAGGGMWAAGVGGPMLGKGWHLGVIDDPLKNAKQAASETIREGQKEWFGSTFYTREEPISEEDPHGAVVVIMQRWDEDDLSGWLLSEESGDEPERWHIVNFEAIKEEEEQEFPATCTVEPDWRKPGEALCPERRPLEKLRRIMARIGSYFWNALYQQRPMAREGNRFKRDWFETTSSAPLKATRVRYWDKAGTAGGGAFTAGVLMARDRTGVYVEDVVRGQWSAHEREKRIKETAKADNKKYGNLVHIWLEQEPGSGGKESAESTIRNLLGYIVRKERVTGDKETRAEPFAAQAEAGNVKLVKANWNKKYLDELCAFPHGKYKDQVDASSGAFNKLAFGSGEAEEGDPLW
jgi:predicted phage terminase large subunit-like protein